MSSLDQKMMDDKLFSLLLRTRSLERENMSLKADVAGLRAQLANVEANVTSITTAFKEQMLAKMASFEAEVLLKFSSRATAEMPAPAAVTDDVPPPRAPPAPRAPRGRPVIVDTIVVDTSTEPYATRTSTSLEIRPRWKYLETVATGAPVPAAAKSTALPPPPPPPTADTSFDEDADDDSDDDDGEELAGMEDRRRKLEAAAQRSKIKKQRVVVDAPTRPLVDITNWLYGITSYEELPPASASDRVQKKFINGTLKECTWSNRLAEQDAYIQRYNVSKLAALQATYPPHRLLAGFAKALAVLPTIQVVMDGEQAITRGAYDFWVPDVLIECSGGSMESYAKTQAPLIAACTYLFLAEAARCYKASPGGPTTNLIIAAHILDTGSEDANFTSDKQVEAFRHICKHTKKAKTAIEAYLTPMKIRQLVASTQHATKKISQLSSAVKKTIGGLQELIKNAFKEEDVAEETQEAEKFDDDEGLIFDGSTSPVLIRPQPTYPSGMIERDSPRAQRLDQAIIDSWYEPQEPPRPELIPAADLEKELW